MSDMRPSRSSSLTISRWHPPADNVRLWALFGCLQPPRHLLDAMDGPSLRRLRTIAFALYHEPQGGPPLAREVVAEAALVVTESLHRHRMLGCRWTVPDADLATARDPFGLDVPALWGVSSIVSSMVDRLEKIKSGSKTKFRNERNILSAAIDVGNRLTEMLTVVTGFEGGPGRPQPWSGRSRHAWRDFDHTARLAGAMSWSVVFLPNGNPPLVLVRTSKPEPDDAA